MSLHNPYRGGPPPHRVTVVNQLPARPGEERPAIRVRARIEWTTGEEVIETWASRYDPVDGGVFVAVADPRCSTTGVWLRSADIQRLD